MKKTFITLTVSAALLLGQNGWAKVFQTPDKSFTTTAAPLDISGSADGRYTFVLTEGGELVISGESAEPEVIKVDPAFDKIYASARGDKITLSSKTTKQVQEIFVDFLQEIETKGAPFLGAENAPVVLTVFSDFQ